MNSSASEPRHQNWHTIILLFNISFIVSWLFITIFAWDVWTDWPSFSKHYPYLKKMVFNYLLNREEVTSSRYWIALKDSGLTTRFFAHVLCPIVPASILSYYIAKIAYVNGGREKVRHISGPKFYAFSAAISHANRKLKHYEK